MTEKQRDQRFVDDERAHNLAAARRINDSGVFIAKQCGGCAPPVYVESSQVQQEAVGEIVVEGPYDISECVSYSVDKLPLGTKLYTHPAVDALGAVRELVVKWSDCSKMPRLPGPALAQARVCARELEAALRPSAGEGKGNA